MGFGGRLLRLPVQLVVIAAGAVMQEATHGDEEVLRLLSAIAQRCGKIVERRSVQSRAREKPFSNASQEETL